MISRSGLDLSSRTTRHVTELVGDTSETRSESGRRDFPEEDGHDTPGALNTGLHEEAAGSQTSEAARQDPERDERSGVTQSDEEPAISI